MKLFDKFKRKKIKKESEIVSDNLSNEKKEPISQDEKSKDKSDELLNIEAPSEEAQLEEAEEAVKKQGTKKKKISSLIGMLINIAVVAGILAYKNLLNQD